MVENGLRMAEIDSHALAAGGKRSSDIVDDPVW